MTALCSALGNPQDAFESVQITGTNGKSSTARVTAALLQAEGVATGLYTSPELERYPERIEIGGEVVSDADFALALGAALAAARALRGDDAVGTEGGFTEFELLTAAALWLFRERGVEVAVLEVGLGGRWDATSVVSAERRRDHRRRPRPHRHSRRHPRSDRRREGRHHPHRHRTGARAGNGRRRAGLPRARRGARHPGAGGAR